MGKIVVILVAFSMVAFIGTDLLQGNSALFGQSNTIGEINGTTIKYEDFTRRVELISYNYSLNTGRNPSSTELEQIRQQAWQELVVENIFQPEFEDLGIQVTNQEVVDMVQGNNINPQIRQYFTDPNTGVFDKANVVNFLRNLSQATPQQRQSWIAFESTLAPARQLEKYENLLELTKFATKYDAKAEYMKSASAAVDYLYIPYSSVSDTMFNASDSELSSYLSNNSEEYQREETKSLSFVEFPIQPSADDTLDIRSEMLQLSAGLANAQDDSVFANINSEGFVPFRTYNNTEDIPEQLKLEDGSLVAEGTISEPFVSGSNFVIHKLSSSGPGDEYFVKASHILFSIDDENGKSEAQRVLGELRNGGDFETAARTYGTDGTASRGGDLGWFGENSAFVQEFKDAAFNYSGVGLIPNVIETEFGYHIIKVTEPKTNVVYQVATIEREIYASDLTLNDIYRDADQFAVAAETEESFETEATARNLQVRKASNINKNDKRVGSMQEARTIVYWLFNKADNGTVSDVFELDDKYVVAVQTGYQEEGTASLSQVRNQITRKVLDEKKAQYILDKVNGLSGSYEEMAASYGTGARTGSAQLQLSSNSFADLGFAPEAVGVAFSLEQGESTKAFEMPNGVVMLSVTSKDAVEEQSAYDAYKSIVINNQRSFRRSAAPFTYQNIYNALTENADIEDNRYKFY